MQKFQVPPHGPPYLYLYAKKELGVKTKWLQLKKSVGKLPKLIQKGVFLCFNVEGQICDYEGGQPVNDP